jgi:hypothetical protein
MTDKETPEGLFFSPEDLEEVTQKQLDMLEEYVNQYNTLLEEFDDDLDAILHEINQSEVYKELGVELHVDHEFIYSVEDREDDE